MANNYIQSSFAIHNWPKEAVDYFLSRVQEDENSDCESPDYEDYRICYSIRTEVDADGTFFVWDDDGCINLDAVTELIKETMAKFNIPGVVDLSAAYTCSKPRTNEFGGVAAIVNAKEIRFLDVEGWMAQTAKEMGRV